MNQPLESRALPRGWQTLRSNVDGTIGSVANGVVEQLARRRK